MVRSPVGVSFVTLERDGELLGCVGALEPRRPLGIDVAEHAVAAAFGDPRVPPIDADDYAAMSINVSVLGALEPLAVGTLDALHDTLAPGRDGVAIELGARRATFLPAVWRQLPDPVSFCRQLWHKGGFEPGTWPAGLRAARYRALEVMDSGPRRRSASTAGTSAR